MLRDLSLELHVLTARLDRAADRILRAELDLSYRRFLALFTIGDAGHMTQRALAQRLGVTDPSVSRMVGVLAGSGLLEAQPDPAGGNRRRLCLTPAGREVAARCQGLLEGRLAALVARSGVAYVDYARDTHQLLAALDASEQDEGRAGAPGERARSFLAESRSGR